MKGWVVWVVVVLGATELYQGLQAVTLPLPVYGVAGLLLAIASNSQQWRLDFLRFKAGDDAAENRLSGIGIHSSALDSLPLGSSVMPENVLPETISPENMSPETISPEQGTIVVQAVTPRYYPGPQLPNLTPAKSPTVSFEIRKPKS